MKSAIHWGIVSNGMVFSKCGNVFASDAQYIFKSDPRLFTESVKELSCKTCLGAVAKCLGLAKDTPYYMIMDMAEEKGFHL